MCSAHLRMHSIDCDDANASPPAGAVGSTEMSSKVRSVSRDRVVITNTSTR